MPLVRVSVVQLDAAQQLYKTATKFINGHTPTHNHALYIDLVAAVTRCKEEYTRHGGTAFTQD